MPSSVWFLEILEWRQDSTLLHPFSSVQRTVPPFSTLRRRKKEKGFRVFFGRRRAMPTLLQGPCRLTSPCSQRAALRRTLWGRSITFPWRATLTGCCCSSRAGRIWWPSGIPPLIGFGRWVSLLILSLICVFRMSCAVEKLGKKNVIFLAFCGPLVPDLLPALRRIILAWWLIESVVCNEWCTGPWVLQVGAFDGGLVSELHGPISLCVP